MQHEDYYQALERLKTNKPQILSKNSYKINKDTVALEAGRKRGTIKPSRAQFKELIEEIELVGNEYNNKEIDKLKKVQALAERYKEQSESFRKDYLAALNREVMLVKRVKDLETQVQQLEAEKKVIYLKKDGDKTF